MSYCFFNEERQRVFGEVINADYLVVGMLGRGNGVEVGRLVGTEEYYVLISILDLFILSIINK